MELGAEHEPASVPGEWGYGSYSQGMCENQLQNHAEQKYWGHACSGDRIQ